jgi:hypothetical protein
MAEYNQFDISVTLNDVRAPYIVTLNTIATFTEEDVPQEHGDGSISHTMIGFTGFHRDGDSKGKPIEPVQIQLTVEQLERVIKLARLAEREGLVRD